MEARPTWRPVRMNPMVKFAPVLLLVLALAGCGSTPGQRAVSGGLIGAGVGAGAGALTAR
jgi:osmotically inducible lipoprotein OsmB